MRGPMPCAPSSKHKGVGVGRTVHLAVRHRVHEKGEVLHDEPSQRAGDEEAAPRVAPASTMRSGPARGSPRRSRTGSTEPEARAGPTDKAALVVQSHEAAALTHIKWKMSICGMSIVTPAMAQPKCE